MTWGLSRFRAGALVEVRSKEEILATLEQDGSLDRLPFMPEMLQFCGKRFRVGAVAHKTCDTAHQTWKPRRLKAAVHLDGLRCDGSAHGGCQAECNLFWKDQWLRLPDDDQDRSGSKVAAKNAPAAGTTEAHLLASTRQSSVAEGAELRYSCQATQLYEATQPLPWWDMRQYVFDVVTGNHSSGRVSRVLFLGFLRWCLGKVPLGYRFFKGFSDGIHRLLTGRPGPSLQGQIQEGSPTPTGRLDLNAGEYVRIKTRTEIEQTLGENGKNRGLSFDEEEMAPYCGRVVKVHKSVAKIIHEPTGKMIYMKQPCIMLEGVVCRGEYARGRLNCPRAIPSYWREIWVERIGDDRRSRDEPNPAP